MFHPHVRYSAEQLRKLAPSVANRFNAKLSAYAVARRWELTCQTGKSESAWVAADSAARAAMRELVAVEIEIDAILADAN